MYLSRICLNFDNNYLPERKSKSSHELQLALPFNPAGIHLFQFWREKYQSKVWNLFKISNKDNRITSILV